MDLNEIRRLVLEGKYFFYTHALTEAKKDGIAPEDAVHAILTGEVIEEYPDRQRVLIFATLLIKYHCTSFVTTRRPMCY